MKIVITLIVLFFNMLAYSQTNNGTSRDTVGICSNVEIEAEFKDPLGWKKYLVSNLRFPQEWQDSLLKMKIKKNFTTVTISFIVCTDGGVCQVVANGGAPEALAKEAMRIIKKSSGKWKPGMQEGKAVKSYHEQKITFAHLE